ncbi:S-layer homology domain-containing protein [Paenibacillus sp. CN-4]|uniref:S-layer homology domain-containing protein n=1 Tax=Paenibacillus nanchangensis TaxID=3348343 RepID=UPI003977F865
MLPVAYYSQAVSTAGKLENVNGRGNGRFEPEGEISRQEMIVMTARALTASGATIPAASGTLSGMADYRDAHQTADYAAEMVDTMLKAGWIQGHKGMIHPEARANRAEAAMLLYKVYSEIQNRN